MKVAEEPTLYEACQSHREPFIFHRDAVSSDLHRSLAREYKKREKPFLLAEKSDSGVYPADSWWLIPRNVSIAWIRKHLAPMIATTDLFPDSENVFFHAGKIGDIIAALPVIKKLGGGRIVIGEHSAAVHLVPMRGAPYDAIRPLLMAQPYITGVDYEDEPSTSVTHDLGSFRQTNHIKGENLIDWQARHLDADGVDVSPWLVVPEFKPHGKVVMARSQRYHNFFFPWPELVYDHRENSVFVGTRDEHRDFMIAAAGQKIEYVATADMLELARLIAGASLFIGNQSAPFWIAAGLGVPLIQETWEVDQNSIVPHENAIYTRTGPETRTLMFRLKLACQRT